MRITGLGHAGMYIETALALGITNNVFQGNTATPGSGGGLASEYSSFTVELPSDGEDLSTCVMCVPRGSIAGK